MTANMVLDYGLIHYFGGGGGGGGRGVQNEDLKKVHGYTEILVVIETISFSPFLQH